MILFFTLDTATDHNFQGRKIFRSCLEQRNDHNFRFKDRNREQKIFRFSPPQTQSGESCFKGGVREKKRAKEKWFIQLQVTTRVSKKEGNRKAIQIWQKRNDSYSCKSQLGFQNKIKMKGTEKQFSFGLQHRNESHFTFLEDREVIQFFLPSLQPQLLFQRRQGTEKRFSFGFKHRNDSHFTFQKTREIIQFFASVLEFRVTIHFSNNSRFSFCQAYSHKPQLLFQRRRGNRKAIQFGH